MRYIYEYYAPSATQGLRDAGWKGSGWYYYDEAGTLVGPFTTQEAASRSLSEYLGEG